MLAYAVESFHPRLTLACSFQKEESVLFHMLMRAARPGGVRAFTIDTGRAVPGDAGDVEALRGALRRCRSRCSTRAAPDEPWTVENCCSAAKVAALEQALTGVDAWITGIRREQAPTRAQSPKLELDERRGIWKLNPLADWTEKDVWRYIFDHDLPYNPLHDQGYASIGCAPCTLPGAGREGRWAGTGQDRVRHPRRASGGRAA